MGMQAEYSAQDQAAKCLNDAASNLGGIAGPPGLEAGALTALYSAIGAVLVKDMETLAKNCAGAASAASSSHHSDHATDTSLKVSLPSAGGA